MISEKIKNQIKELNLSEDLKKLLIRILEEEDKGTYKYKELYDKFVSEYINSKGGDSDDKN